MRIPTFDNLRAAAFESSTRFPFVLLAATVATIAGIILVDAHEEFTWGKVLLAAQLGIPLLFAIAVTEETRSRPRSVQFAAIAIAAGALTVYGLTFPDEITTVAITRHIQFTIGLHLLVAFVPFTAPGRLNGFWQYNRALFLRFCLSALYSVVLYGGLALALVAIDKLLGIEVEEEMYPRLWFLIAGLFNTWVFVGGVPKDILGLENTTDYTKGLRVFAQYILIPLVIVYSVILTIYLGKVIVTREWPSGWIGYLVSSVAVVGILAHLLVHPIREDTGSQWVRTYSRWYYAAMIPAIVMLLMAVGKRIDQYGVTENRYLLAVMAGWLALISVYFIVSRVRNIKLIPVTLCILAFATSLGPWGAFAVSQRSQMGRLVGLLEKNNILVDDVIRPASDGVPFADRKEISAVLDYLVTTHGPDRIAPWFGDRWAEIDTFTVEGRSDRAPYGGNTLVRRIMEGMSLEYVSQWNKPLTESDEFHISVEPSRDVFPLEEADVLVRIHAPMCSAETVGTGQSIAWDDSSQAFYIDMGGDSLAIDMESWVEDLIQNLTGPAGSASMTFEQARLSVENESLRAIVHVQTISGEIQDGAIEIYDMAGLCLLRWKE